MVQGTWLVDTRKKESNMGRREVIFGYTRQSEKGKGYTKDGEAGARTRERRTGTSAMEANL